MTPSAPDVTFIIAAYNAADTLARAIDSALAQTGVSVEVIVADDCSTDETRAVAESYAGSNVRLLALPRNGGPSVARNAAIAEAKGRWLAVLDSDDAVTPERMARLIARAEKAGTQIAVDNLRVIRADGTPAETMFAERTLQETPELTLSAFIRSNALFEATHNFGYLKPVFLRSFIESHGLEFDEALRIGEDYLFLAAALALGGRCVIEPAVGYDYHIREGSISRVLALHHIDDMIEGDKNFLEHHRLDAEAAAAQTFRTRSLHKGRAFLVLVQNIKDRSVFSAIRTAWNDPGALAHLRMPVVARLNRAMMPLRKLTGADTDLPAIDGTTRSSQRIEP
ncbi:glycosyltransferase family 2 protein [Rhizobium grahamii]|uniref:Glycosyltransferase family 2 protein n=1 Tax=Rhizobium grahamii TaxID=1120045 RepID=A0A5Q0CAY9_9HYPH|nr:MULTISPECIES: glycosyltransferase family 2 protein [Rhizobium]QFY61041.1 glycosyltransferase family 2 protein [Rhizobium grahamii]QRM49808.1 glycosyltransferase family 2 protein [Rhizobium sp. BG6]